jgi:hypothetical protein
LREKGYKESSLQPLKLDPTRKNRKAITRILKTSSNELWSVWPLDTLLSLDKLIELKKASIITTCGKSALEGIMSV